MSPNQPVQTDDELLKPKQVADELQLNIETIYRYILASSYASCGYLLVSSVFGDLN